LHLAHGAALDLYAADDEDGIVSVRVGQHSGQGERRSSALDQSLAVLLARLARMPRGGAQRAEVLGAARALDLD
jgi:plasmid stabilization system protein ParE